MSESLNELISRLDRLTGDAEESVKRGVLRAAQKIQGDAKRLALVDTGRLRASVTAYVTEEGGEIVGICGTNVHYAPYVEFGTGAKGDPSVPHTAKEFWRWRDAHGRWHSSSGQRAYPFLRPAFDLNRKNAETAIANEIRKAIKEASGK